MRPINFGKWNRVMELLSTHLTPFDKEKAGQIMRELSTKLEDLANSHERGIEELEKQLKIDLEEAKTPDAKKALKNKHKIEVNQRDKDQRRDEDKLYDEAVKQIRDAIEAAKKRKES